MICHEIVSVIIVIIMLLLLLRLVRCWWLYRQPYVAGIFSIHARTEKLRVHSKGMWRVLFPCCDVV